MNYLTSYKSNKNIIYSCKYHIIWCTKFRRDLLKEQVDIDLKNPAGVGTCYKDVLKPIDEHKSRMSIALVNTTALYINEKYILHVIEYNRGDYIDHSGVYKIKNLPSYLVNTFDGKDLTTDKSRNILEDTKKEFLKSLNNKLVDDLLSNYRYFYNGI